MVIKLKSLLSLTAILSLLFYNTFLFAVTVEVQIYGSEPDSAYLCWNPAPARIRLTSEETTDIDITLTSVKRDEERINGQVVFGDKIPDNTSPYQSYQPTKVLSLALPKDGSWVDFLISGYFDNANNIGYTSLQENDAHFILINNKTAEVVRYTTTVRARKNAENLTIEEWRRLILTLNLLHDLENDSVNSRYAKYPSIHKNISRMGHYDSAFLPWHRAFILSLERELQQIDPIITLPYWDYGKEHNNIFTSNTMGEYATSGKVDFGIFHPWNKWRFGDKLLIDSRHGNASDLHLYINNENRIINFNPEYSILWHMIQATYHDSVHSALRGWLVLGVSPADPIFFLLHSNVDRVWAKWQHKYSRYDATDPSVFTPQGSWEDADPEIRGNRSKGNWSKDTLWPWDGDTSNANGEGRRPLNELIWHDHPVLDVIEFPVIEGYNPEKIPDITAMIDYIGALEKTKPLGYCYDTVPYNE